MNKPVIKSSLNLITPVDNLYDAGFVAEKEVSRITADTFMRRSSGMAGSIVYLDEGARLYDEFKKRHSPKCDPSQSDAARLIATHKSAITNEISDIERLIVIGGGSYDSFMSQEMELIKNIVLTNKNSPLKEIVLIDVSSDFLEESARAVNDGSKQIGRSFHVLPMRADFKKVAGNKFDDIMRLYDAKPRNAVKSAVISTGATFANIENIVDLGSVPTFQIDTQMATFGEFVGNGSTVIFDHFTQLHNSEIYYDQPELRAFFTNLPNIMKKYCENLKDFKINDPSHADDIFFNYKPKTHWNARVVAHQLVVETPQVAKIINGTEKVLTIDDRYNVMYSMRPRADDISNRPTANTGLESKFYASSKDLVMHVMTKTDISGSVLEEHGVDERAYGLNISSGGDESPRLKRAISSFLDKIPRPSRLQPLILGG